MLLTHMFSSLGECNRFHAVETLPTGSYVVPFWVCYNFLVRDFYILPKKELHFRFWVRISSKLWVEGWGNLAPKVP